MARLSKLYLLCYNSLQSLGWFFALLRLLPCLAPPLSIHSAYAVAGELILWTIYQALPFVKERNLYSGFFQKFSMSYHSFLVGGLLCYPFLWLKLYLHVFKQRKSKLGKMDRKKRA
ncbi:hypothetical protein PR202_ga05364 [Eleusine coracana subsp. coracana]|uniref:Very-long-chain (3R)-3-hydroxyacyl-CoA dehydratase n=1 Tax=Eleusine coracana subsp. coracana TaxID=191504 RepID=A0AAV5BR31_ELECO|nr:hypothetical protein PR202_ga04911 [Eleusine coracana subsp. coracana]GJM89199.1 hypothetical protein PR202_ga05364 [Eleusine coracana subsp. coracana]